MRVCLDCSSAAAPTGTGIAQYIKNLLKAYAAAPAGEQFTVCWRPSRFRHRRTLLEDLAPRFRRAVWQPPLPPLGGGRFDVFHGLDVRTPRLLGTPAIATIHDIFSVVSDEFAKPKFRKKKIAQYRRTLARAAAVICDSECTAADLRTHLDAPPEKLVVIPLGVDEVFRPEAAADIDRLREVLPVPEEYLLFVGRMDKRKNVVRLIEAFERAAPEVSPDLHLLLIGSGGHGEQDVAHALEHSRVRDRIVTLGHVDDGFLPPLYAAASGLAFATLYEGFGMPVLEAMASGCPVLTSTVGSAGEICGEHGLLVDPRDTDAIAGGLVRMMTDGAWRERAIAGALARAQQFTWSRTALATRRLYHRVVHGEAPAGERPAATA